MPSLILTNSWSLLYDTMYGPEDEQNLVEYKITMTDKPNHLWKYNEDMVISCQIFIRTKQMEIIMVSI